MPIPPTPSLIAHRGGARNAPENTLAAFRSAATLGVSWIECDVTLLRDGSLVIFHDETVNRCTDGRGRIRDMDRAAVSALDAGNGFGTAFTGERIPSLGQTLDLCCDLGLAINLELKIHDSEDADLARAVADHLANAARLPPLLFSSFSLPALREFRRLDPQADLGFITSHLPRQWRGIAADLGLVSLHVNARFLRRGQIAALQNAGYRVFAYTVNEADQARRLLDWGVDGVFTDCPQDL
ncbi:MAG: glycerophosphoryl diester phosphodiesterase [Magnetospiraceae bacterium]